MALSADQSWTNSGAGTLTVSGSINNSGHALELGGSGATVLSGVIHGAGGISKVGAGSLSLTGTNTYTGPTAVSAGLVTAARGAVDVVMVIVGVPARDAPRGLRAQRLLLFLGQPLRSLHGSAPRAGRSFRAANLIKSPNKND
jgi:autotransporter-associated beta strand protein